MVLPLDCVTYKTLEYEKSAWLLLSTVQFDKQVKVESKKFKCFLCNTTNLVNECKQFTKHIPFLKDTKIYMKNNYKSI